MQLEAAEKRLVLRILLVSFQLKGYTFLKGVKPLNQTYPYSSKRSLTYGRAMALASNPSAAAAGRKILEAGGNAVDAAVAMAAAQVVAEPTSNGLGSDLFAIVAMNDALYGYNGSGKSPAAISLAAMKAKGYDAMPDFGIEAAGVPGAVRAWADIHKKHGRLPFKEVLAPAIEYAEKGFVLSPTVARLWAMELEKRRGNRGPLYDAFWAQFSFEGAEVWELPPNGQGISVLMALEILKHKPTSPDDGKSAHYIAEAIKRAMTDAAKYVADPAFMSLSPEDLLNPDYLKKCSDAIGEEAETVRYGNPLDRSTVYFCAGDKDGNMVSMIQSNYDGFGAGIVVPETGISLNNRLLNFTFEDGHDNCLAGNKRPYHTIIPGFLTKEGKPYGAFGVMGGFMQPQGHVQTLLQLLRYGRNPQAALDAPRFMWTGDKDLVVEEDYDADAVEELIRRGHRVIRPPHDLDMGRGQYMLYDRDRKVYIGGTEKRCDGTISVAE